MTKADIVEMLYEKVGIPKQQTVWLTELFFDIMKETLEKGETVKITGFGNFVVLNKKARPGRNPKTAEKITITPRRVISFRPSPALKEAMDKKK